MTKRQKTDYYGIYMNISTLAKMLGVSINELRNTGVKNGMMVFGGRNTRIPYNLALEITKILKPEKLSKLKNDDKIYLPETVKVIELAETINKPSGLVLKTLLLNGVMVTLNEKIDYDTASLISSELGVEVYPENPEQFSQTQEIDTNLIKIVEYSTDEDKKKYKTRPPVVTVMGHVDHGKTTLLDFIKKTNVVATEAGAITQHISSYKIKFKDKYITFLDTPGHEAFTAMRARGSQLADFIILVVSATEGVKPQTVEVIERAKLTKTQVIVAINKIDLPESDPERVKAEISNFGLTPEEWGGNTPFINISAKTGQNIDKLLENLLLFAEVSNLKGQVDCQGQAIVIESNLDKAEGVITNVLVVKDQIKIGDIIRCGLQIVRIKKLLSSDGKKIQVADLSDPVTVFGLNQLAEIGEHMIVYDSIKEAQKDADIEAVNRNNKIKIINHSKQISDNNLNLILKADVAGSLEALKESIIKIPQEQTKISIKAETIGEITDADINFAQTTNSTILAFNTKISSKAKILIKKNEINIFQSNIIYEILEWVEEQIYKNIKHDIKIETLGRAEILGVFKSEKNDISIFGGEVKFGKILDNKKIRIIRDNKVIADGEIIELQKNKTKVKEANVNQQFGLSAKGLKSKPKIGDIIECIDEIVLK